MPRAQPRLSLRMLFPNAALPVRHRAATPVVAALAAFVALASPPAPAMAGETWNDLRPQIFGAREILPGDGLLQLSAPFRPEDQSFVPLSLHARSGAAIRAVTLIIDENPVPVAAEFTIGGDRHDLTLAAHFRLNRASDVRAVVETDDGALHMVSRFVRFAGGQAACSAPANGDPDEIARNMGRMEFSHEETTEGATLLRPHARLKTHHPNHTGMVLDQTTLLYIPMRIVSDLEVRQGEELVFAMKGSIALSQDPEIEFTYRTNGATVLRARATDTDDTSWTQDFPIGPGS